MTKVIVYGIGGYDSTKVNDNIVDEYEIEDPIADEIQLARESALSKLTALGLTEEEARAIAGV